MSDYYKNKGIEDISTISISIDEEDFVTSSVVDETNRILFVGRLDDNKRPEWAVHAFKKLDLTEDHELIIVGSGHRKQEIEKLIQESEIHDKVTFTGKIPREEVLKLMAGAKALILPSKFEMAGNVIIEAMASGCPVIASDTMGASHLIDDGNNGLLFDKKSKQELVEKLQHCLVNETTRRRLRQNGWKVAKKNYVTETIADQYLSVSEEYINPANAQD
jgi:glycosyltransferase involved in cell wall biosynthesis